MPGKLRCNKIDLNDKTSAEKVLKALANVEKRCYDLIVYDRYCFKVNGEDVPTEAGWYVILDNKDQPLYVGETKNLDYRLNTNDGSRDNFANPQRSSDSERNFIKKFNQIGVIPELKVFIITESELATKLGIHDKLSDLDRKNIEKLINLYRYTLFK